MNFLERMLFAFGVSKQMKIEEKPTEIKHGASYVSSGGKAGYSQLGSLAAFTQHPYVYAALSRITQDLAATPLRLIKGKGKNSQIIEDHPVIDLLEQPSTTEDQFSFLEQLTLDLVAAGNCYILLLGETEQPVSMIRLHPEQVEIITDQYGIVAYRYNADGVAVEYSPDRVLHGKNVSWNTGSKGLYGVGAIQPIQEEILADIHVSRLVSEASKKGRPDVILSPKSEVDIWGMETRREILDSYNGMTKSGGALVTSGQIDVQIANISPRDVEFQAARQYAKLSITASFGTPLSVLGEGSANYATARQEAISYWSTLAKRGKRISALLTRVAKLWESDLRFEFDYSGVEALNQMRSDQLERINLHVMNGMGLADAYAYEGLEDAPVVSSEKFESEAEVVGDEEEESQRALIEFLTKDFSTKAKDDDALAEYGSLQEAFDALPEPTQKALTTKAQEHNDEHPEKSKRTSKLKLAAVYWRGIGAYKTNPDSVFPNVGSAEQWAMGRVNSFLYALRNGRFRSGKHDTDLLPKDHPMAKEEDKSFEELLQLLASNDSIIEKGSVGDRDPTNFPEDGKDQKISLSNSTWRVFDPEFAEDLKQNHPKIWKAGGNIEGNNQYRRLYPIATRSDDEQKTETEEMAIRKREAWVARHFEDGRQFKEDPDLSPNLSNIAGIVAQIKWLAVGTLGQSEMKRIINEVKAKQSERRQQKRIETWNTFIKSKQEPAERMILRSARSYLKDAARRYEKRIKQNVTKGIVDLKELEALAEERTFIFNSIGGQFQRIWSLVGSEELASVFRIAKKEKPIDLEFSSRDLMFEYIDQMASEISRTTADAVSKSIQNGLIEGKSVEEIASNINQIAAFGIGRSMLIARTESTKAVNRASVAAYQQAQSEGLNIKKEWLTSADGNARETHVLLDGVQVGVNEVFETENGTASAPADFGVPEEDCNCRCTVIPVVE